jgi:hypothetical protein
MTYKTFITWENEVVKIDGCDFFRQWRAGKRFFFDRIENGRKVYVSYW